MKGEVFCLKAFEDVLTTSEFNNFRNLQCHGWHVFFEILIMKDMKESL